MVNPILIQAKDFEGENLALFVVTNPKLSESEAEKLVKDTFEEAWTEAQENDLSESYVSIAEDILDTNGIKRVYVNEVICCS